MKKENPTLYVRELIQHFQMPGTDSINEFMFSPDNNAVWDSGVLVSIQSGFYADIFQFWVRAFFCFSEEMADGSMLPSVVPFIACDPIPPGEFERSLFNLISQHKVDTYNERVSRWSETFAELQKQTFLKSFRMLKDSEIESSVAETGGGYIAYFHRTKSCPSMKQPRTLP